MKGHKVLADSVIWADAQRVFFTSLLSSAFLKIVSTDSRLHTRVVHSRTSAHLKHISALPCPLSLIRVLAIWLVMWFGLILFAPDCRCTFITYLPPSLSQDDQRGSGVWSQQRVYSSQCKHTTAALSDIPLSIIYCAAGTISLSPTVAYCLCAANFLSLSVSLGCMTLCAICLFISTTSS